MEKVAEYMRKTKKPRLFPSKPAIQSKDLEVKNCAKCDSDDERSVDKYEQFVPRYIYRTVRYVHRKKKHAEAASPRSRLILSHIDKYYQIPQDFEQSQKFGPHSGLNYNSRLIRACLMGSLPTRRNVDKNQIPNICLTCGKTGHLRRNCPDGF